MSLAKSILVYDSTGNSEKTLLACHAAEGRLFLTESICMDTATQFMALMQYMESEKKTVQLFINCCGGEVNAGLLMYDLIRSYPYDMEIYCTGLAASMAAILLAGGRKGKRFILPHSHVLIHEPRVPEGFGGTATTIEKQAQSILEIKTTVNSLLAEATGKSLGEINEATAYDNFMTAEEAVAFGICDEIKAIY